jgi:hypothetical protein
LTLNEGPIAKTRPVTIGREKRWGLPLAADMSKIAVRPQGEATCGSCTDTIAYTLSRGRRIGMYAMQPWIIL